MVVTAEVITDSVMSSNFLHLVLLRHPTPLMFIIVGKDAMTLLALGCPIDMFG